MPVSRPTTEPHLVVVVPFDVTHCVRLAVLRFLLYPHLNSAADFPRGRNFQRSVQPSAVVLSRSCAAEHVPQNPMIPPYGAQ